MAKLPGNEQLCDPHGRPLGTLRDINIEEPAAAVRVAPALGVHAAGVVTHVEIVRPLLRTDVATGCAARAMCAWPP